MATKTKRKHKRHRYHVIDATGRVIHGKPSITSALVAGYKHARRWNLALRVVKGGGVLNGVLVGGKLLIVLTEPA